MARTLLLVLALSLSTLSMGQSMQTDWQAKWANMRSYTLAVAKAMPADGYAYSPLDSGMMSFGEQLVHLADNIVWLSTSKLAEGARPDKSTIDAKDKEAVMSALDKAFLLGGQTIGRLSYAEIEQEVTWREGSTLTKRRIGLLMFDHVTHHRAQAIVYLRLRGVEAPAYVGW